MRELAHVLYADGYDATTLLLPGHGTTPEDLAAVEWKDWVRTVRETFEEVRPLYNRVFLCGQSMGGAVSLLISKDCRVDGIITLSTGYTLPFWKLWFLRIVSPFVKFIAKHDGPDIKDPVAKQSEIHYDRMPVRAILQLAQLLAALRRNVRKISAPLLLIHAAEDHTFPRRHQDWLATHVSSTVKETLVLDNSYHVATLDYDKGKIHDGVRQFLRKLTRK